MPNTEFYKGKRQFYQTVSPDATGDDTIKLIVKTINSYSQSPFVSKTAELIKKQSPDAKSFFKNLFEVACKNVKYLADEAGHEVIYTPLLLMKMGKGDCKKYSVFIGSVLKNAGYEPIIKVVKYNPQKDWEHVYINVKDESNPKGYITLDPVNHCKFDSEVEYNKARENYLNGTYSKIMNGNKLSMMGNITTDNTAQSMMGDVNKSANSLVEDLAAITGVGHCNNKRSYHTISGLAAIEQDYMNGVNDENQIHGDEDGMNGISEIGRRKSTSQRAPKTKKDKTAKKAQRKKFFHKLKKFAPAMLTTRLAFLSLVKLGGALQKMKGLHINLAKHLADAMADPVRAKPVLDIWYRFGGEKEALMKAIAQAGKSSMHGVDAETMIMAGMAGLGVAPAVAAAAVITAATPILVPIIKMFKKQGKISPQAADVIEGGVETAENLTQNPDGSINEAAIKTLQNSQLVRTSLDLDQGGNQATTQDIQAEAAQEEQGGGSNTDFKSGAPSSDERTVDSALTPVKLQDTPQNVGAKSMFNSIYNPTSWVQITLLISVIGQHINAPSVLVNALTSIAGVCLVLTTINLFINSKIKTNG